MINYPYYLIIGLVVSLILMLLIKKNETNINKDVLQEGGAGYPIPASLFYRPIMPTPNTAQCNKTPDAPGLNYSSLYTSDLPRSMYGDGKATDNYFSSRKNPAPFDPPCLTKKPYGNAMATYNYWKFLPNLLEQQYASCDKYKCANSEENGYDALPRLEKCIKTEAGKVEPSPTLACDVVNQEYYNSPEDFCRTHPEDYPCANWWMNNPVQIRDVSRCPELSSKRSLAPQIATIEASKTEKNPLGFCLSTDPNCGLSDGQALLMVKRHHEDHGLC